MLPVLFLAVIWLPMVNSVGEFWKFERKSENRVFRDSLHFDGGNLYAFPSQADEYVNDNFSFRGPLLEAYNYEKFNMFHISPHPDKTIIGRDGWFFMAQKEREIFEGKKPFSEVDLAKFDSVWTFRKHYLDSLGIVCHWMIGPMKHTIYSEKLPFNILRTGEKTRVMVLEDHLAKKFPDLMVNPVPSFLLAKDSTQLYYKLDNHWNQRAGIIAANLIIEKLQEQFPNLEKANYNNFNWVDTTYERGYHRGIIDNESLVEFDLAPVAKNEKSFQVESYGFPAPVDFPYPTEFEKVYRNKSDTLLPKILIIRDSFGNQLIPFLKDSFKESVFIFDGWAYDLNEDIIERVQPDIVIFLGLETHLEHFID
jgi:hypothetical protein